MPPVVTDVPLPALRELWGRPGCSLDWSCLFTLPAWLEAWSSTLGRAADPYLKAVRDGDGAFGVAPLARDGGTATFLGDPEVCDYQDLVLSPGREAEAVSALWDAWAADGIRELVLTRVRPGSHVLRHLAPHARGAGAAVEVEPVAAGVELLLPASWDEYLSRLDKKQRHEVRRKLRRLDRAGEVRFHAVRGVPELEAVCDGFFAVFRGNREDKAAFLDPNTEAYFRALMRAAAREGLLNLGVLEVDGRIAAATLCFDHCNRTYLYNNGYYREFADLSVGLVGKLFSLRDSIERGVAVYDFLAGDERYKFQLGGTAVSLSRCVIELPSP